MFGGVWIDCFLFCLVSPKSHKNRALWKSQKMYLSWAKKYYFSWQHCRGAFFAVMSNDLCPVVLRSHSQPYFLTLISIMAASVPGCMYSFWSFGFLTLNSFWQLSVLYIYLNSTFDFMTCQGSEGGNIAHRSGVYEMLLGICQHIYKKPFSAATSSSIAHSVRWSVQNNCLCECMNAWMHAHTRSQLLPIHTCSFLLFLFISLWCWRGSLCVNTPGRLHIILVVLESLTVSTTTLVCP